MGKTELENSQLLSELKTAKENLNDLQTQNASLFQAMKLVHDSNTTQNHELSSAKNKIEENLIILQEEKINETKNWREEIKNLVMMHEKEMKEVKKRCNQQIHAYKESSSKAMVELDAIHSDLEKEKKEHLTALKQVRKLTEELHELE